MHISRGVSAHHGVVDVIFTIQQEFAVPECCEVLGITHGWVQTSRPCDIHVEAFACSRTDLNTKREPERQACEAVCLLERVYEKAPRRRSPRRVTHCQGRNCRCRSDEAKCTERSGRRKTLPECRCHGERPSNGPR